MQPALKKPHRPLRDYVLSAVMLCAFAVSLAVIPEKMSPEEKADLSGWAPRKFMGWTSFTEDTEDFRDQWQSINELLIRHYFYTPFYSKDLRAQKTVTMILEYSSDIRNNFSFHFPENCHRSTGNEVDFLPPLEVEMPDGRVIKAKLVYIRGLQKSIEPFDKLVAYWLVIDKKQRHQTFFIKLDQMFAGVLSGSKKGTLVRLDYVEDLKYTPEAIGRGKRAIRDLLVDLYRSTDPVQRESIFGAV